MAGLFDFLSTEDPNQAAYNAMMFGLLGGKGNLNQRLSQGGMNAMDVSQKYRGAQRQSQQDKLMEEYRRAQMAKMLADSVERQNKLAKGEDPDEPKDIQSARLFMAMTPEQQRQALTWRRGDNELKEMDGVLQRISKSGLGGITPLTTLESEAGAQGTIAGSRQRAQEIEKAKYDLVQTFNPQRKATELKPRISLLPQNKQASTGPLLSSDPLVMQKIMEDAKRSGAGNYKFDIGGVTGSAETEQAPLAPSEDKKSGERDDDSIKTKTALQMLEKAEQLLPAATGSGVGAVVDKAAGIFGYTPSGALGTAQLKPLAGWLQLNTPRFEGPQSDNDRLVYNQMVAMIDDDTKPTAQRLAAVKKVKEIYLLYDATRKEVRGSLASDGDKSPVMVKTDADYHALKPGMRFITPNGETGTKK